MIIQIDFFYYFYYRLIVETIDFIAMDCARCTKDLNLIDQFNGPKFNSTERGFLRNIEFSRWIVSWIIKYTINVTILVK